MRVLRIAFPAWMLVLALVSLAPRAAQADTTTFYSIDFTATSSDPVDSPLPSGSFFYDSSTNVFTDFLLTWQGNTFDFTNNANDGVSINSSPSCLDGDSGAVASFLLMTNCPNSGWFAETSGNLFGVIEFDDVYDGTNNNLVSTQYNDFPVAVNVVEGTYTSNAQSSVTTSTPEPATLSLLCAGIILCGIRTSWRTKVNALLVRATSSRYWAN